MEQPLVTVICLCYNHARFLKEAIDSVLIQTYPHIELILVDDCSTDNSVMKISDIVKKVPAIRFIKNEKNIGMCKSFNKALAQSTGEYIIDLAADDVLLPQRIEEQVNAFLNLKETYGIVYSDAYLITENGERITTFYKRNELGGLMEKVPVGEVFKDLVRSYRVCSPTVMIRKKVLEELGGYDENLSYEDYDLFVRSSRNYKYFYIDKPLTNRRVVKGSDSSSWDKVDNNAHLSSTLLVCKKALWLCRNKEEKKALLHSVRYHFRQSYFLNCSGLVKEYYDLITTIGGASIIDRMFFYLAEKKVKVTGLYKIYRKIKSL